MPKQFIRVPKGSVILLSPDILISLQRNCREDHESLDPSVSDKENGHFPMTVRMEPGIRIPSMAPGYSSPQAPGE